MRSSRRCRWSRLSETARPKPTRVMWRRSAKEAAAALGLQLQILNASSIGEIDAAFATLARERPDALFVGGDAFFVGRAVQLATSAALNRIPAAYSLRVHAAAGGLMSYGTDIGDASTQVGVYP